MNCLRREREKEATDSVTLKEKEEMEELAILLEGNQVAEDYRS